MISYKPLHHTLLNKDLKVTNVCKDLKLSSATRTKLNKNESVSLSTIEKLCSHLEVPIEDVVEIVKDSE
ncbi:DNA (cytosine-5)-methyltransferase 1 [Virgibacillus halotolerans]|uniref:helix-turn-helix domain-containing protein n=1 Tax=Virgibacillus halotolerans TaxID=1071053 RepID=UPI0019611CD7|nr:helix-turn-helix transcriptional regulator [Virgibacillus halotolerans]MBM7600478.1 DNA (cytosine-5)-methyltransferase 1 [Virgibacillus halotolerans]